MLCVTRNRQNFVSDIPEVEWFHATGFGELVSSLEQGREIDEEKTAKAISILPCHQAAAVRKRVDTVNSTLRTSNRRKSTPGRRRDIRDIFANVPTYAS